MNQDSDRQDNAKGVKIIGSILMCIGIVMSFIWPVIGGILLLIGGATFVVGRFME